MQRTASSSSWISSLAFPMSTESSIVALSLSSSCPRLRRLVERFSSVSSGGSEESEALGVDLDEEGLLRERVFRSARLEMLEEVEDCWD